MVEDDGDGCPGEAEVFGEELEGDLWLRLGEVARDHRSNRRGTGWGLKRRCVLGSAGPKGPEQNNRGPDERECIT